MVISGGTAKPAGMLGAALGILVWILGFLAVAMGFFGLFAPEVGILFDFVFTWTQVPVVALVYLTLTREGVPGGAGELKRALAWLGDDDAGPRGKEAFARAPFNAALVGLELGAVILVVVGLVLCTLFSISITVSTLGAFGRSVADPTTFAIANVEASDAFLTFVAGGICWQVALFAEGFEAT